MERRKRQAIKVFDDWRIEVSHNLISLAVRDAGNAGILPVIRDRIKQSRQSVFSFTTYDEVYEGKLLHALDVDDRCLRAPKHDVGVRMIMLHFPGNPQSQRIAAANGAEAEEIEREVLEVRRSIFAEVSVAVLILDRPEPVIVEAIQIQNLRLQASLLEHRRQGQDAKRRMLRDGANGISLGNFRVVKVVGRRRTNKTYFHDLCSPPFLVNCG